MESEQVENRKKIGKGIVVSGIINLILGIIAVFPYYIALVFLVIAGFSGEIVTAIYGIIILIVITAIILAVNIAILYFLKKKHKETNKELNKKKYWLINILIYFLPIVIFFILINI